MQRQRNRLADQAQYTTGQLLVLQQDEAPPASALPSPGWALWLRREQRVPQSCQEQTVAPGSPPLLLWTPTWRLPPTSGVAASQAGPATHAASLPNLLCPCQTQTARVHVPHGIVTCFPAGHAENLEV